MNFSFSFPLFLRCYNLIFFKKKIKKKLYLLLEKVDKLGPWISLIFQDHIITDIALQGPPATNQYIFLYAW
jgi:hypothetical protein